MYFKACVFKYRRQIINFIFNKNEGYMIIASASRKGKWINTGFIWENCWNPCSGQVQ